MAVKLEGYTTHGVTFDPVDMQAKARSDWPDAAAKRRMDAFAEGMQRTESVTGVDLQKNMVTVDFGMPIPTMAQGGGLFVTPDFLSESFPFQEDGFVDLLVHESAHLKYQDSLAINIVQQSAGSVTFPAMAKAAYQHNPAFFVHCLETAGITVDNFAEGMDKLLGEMEELFAPLAPLLPLTDKELVKEIYQGADQRIIAACDIEKVGELTTKIMGLNYFPLIQATSIPDNLPPLTVAQKEKLDKVMKSWAPSMARIEQYGAFSGAYSRAVEHRADDFAVMHSQNPAAYFEGLRDTLTYLNSNAAEGDVVMPEILATHPDVEARRDRGMLLDRKLKAARLIDSKIDPLAVIAEVNREWCAPNKKSKMLPPFS